MNRKLIKSGPFVRAAKRFLKKNPQAEQAIRQTLHRLSLDAYDVLLKTHKLKGQLKDSWACSVGYDLRIVFKFVQHEGEEAILLQTMGNHDEVY